MHSPIGWVGGKKRLRNEILRRFPEHTTYVEVFAGAGWVLFGKDPATSKAEAINDLHGELTNFYRCVREKPLELMERLKFRMISAEDFAREKDLKSGGNKGRTETERAAAFFWLLKLSFGAKGSTFGYSVKDVSSFKPELIQDIIQRTHERLKRVYVFNEDFQKLIIRLDRAETFFYCDPPYYGCEKDYEERFTEQDHQRLADTLKAIKGKFLLSYNDHELVRQLYAWATIDSVTTRYSIAKQTNARERVTELLISNYS